MQMHLKLIRKIFYLKKDEFVDVVAFYRDVMKLAVSCWDDTRLIPVAAQTGDIAGVAAGLSIDTGQSKKTLSTEKLQNELSKQGHVINFEEAYGKDWKDVAEERLRAQENSLKKSGV